jgi:hypothetical protein
MRGMGSRIFCVLVALASPAQAQTKTPVVIELVLALDSSASVDPGEFKLQNEGIAQAFRDPEVLQAVDNSSFWCGDGGYPVGRPRRNQVVFPLPILSAGMQKLWFPREPCPPVDAPVPHPRHGHRRCPRLVKVTRLKGSKIIDVSGDGPKTAVLI